MQLSDSHHQDIFLVNKPSGATPLEMIDALRNKYTFLTPDISLTYAGRLDPLASGLLIILAGDRVHEKQPFLDLPKTYHVVFLLEYTTDTLDILGIPTKKPPLVSRDEKYITDTLYHIMDELKRMSPFLCDYPLYSSKTVQGVPLHTYAQEQRLPEKIPQRHMSVLEFENISMRAIDVLDIISAVETICGTVSGNFRQDVIASSWKKILLSDTQKKILVAMDISVTSGTYIRSLVDVLGAQLGCGACIFSLARTRIGEYDLSNALLLEKRKN